MKMLDLYQKQQWFVQKEQLQSGACFGEQALKKGGKGASHKYTETTRAAGDCVLAALDRSTFHSFQGLVNEREKIKLIIFLQQLPFLRSWTKQKIARLSDDFKTLDF
jgi:CRP-like cAMP-binding protein